MAAELEQLLTVREAARLAQRTPGTVRRWIWDGKLPAQKLGNQLFIKRADLEQMTGRVRQPATATRREALETFARLSEELRQQGVEWTSAAEHIEEMRDERMAELTGQPSKSTRMEAVKQLLELGDRIARRAPTLDLLEELYRQRESHS